MWIVTEGAVMERRTMAERTYRGGLANGDFSHLGDGENTQHSLHHYNNCQLI